MERKLETARTAAAGKAAATSLPTGSLGARARVRASEFMPKLAAAKAAARAEVPRKEVARVEAAERGTARA